MPAAALDSARARAPVVVVPSAVVVFVPASRPGLGTAWLARGAILIAGSWTPRFTRRRTPGLGVALLAAGRWRALLPRLARTLPGRTRRIVATVLLRGASRGSAVPRDCAASRVSAAAIGGSAELSVRRRRDQHQHQKPTGELNPLACHRGALACCTKSQKQWFCHRSVTDWPHWGRGAPETCPFDEAQLGERRKAELRLKPRCASPEPWTLQIFSQFSAQRPTVSSSLPPPAW